MTFNTKLTNLLKTDPRLVDDDGELVLAAVHDHAWRLDRAIGEKVVLAYEKKDAATALEEAAIHELEQTLETRAQGYAVDW